MVTYCFLSQQAEKEEQHQVNNTQPFVGTHVTDIVANPAYQVPNGNQEEQTDYEIIDDGQLFN